MNKIFNFSRFGKYFLYDLRNAKNNAGISILVLCLMPVIIFVVYELLSLVFEGHLGSSEECGLVAISAAVCASVLITPKKLYGGLTDKKIGTDFLMLPASTFEKFLSMVLILCVVIPLLLCVMLYWTDSFMCFAFPKYYLPMKISRDMPEELNLSAIVIAGWIGSVLVYTLGAIIFKKSKIAKTILACMLMSLLILPFVKYSADNINDYIHSADEALVFINTALNIQIIGCNSIVLVAIYLRLRFLKH